jgi:hypothetical protein
MRVIARDDVADGPQRWRLDGKGAMPACIPHAPTTRTGES